MSPSLIIRRTHMYLALFLSPWVLMYALSTMAMNHRPFFRDLYNGQPVVWETERELPYNAAFSEDTKRWMIAEQILSDLNMEGAHSLRGNLTNQLTIIRNHAIKPQRIIYTPEEQTLRVETQAFRTNTFLEQMHRRRGYKHKYLTDDLWAITVEVFILSTIIWAASGLWMWWELKATQKWGALCIGSGIAIFTIFLFTI